MKSLIETWPHFSLERTASHVYWTIQKFNMEVWRKLRFGKQFLSNELFLQHQITFSHSIPSSSRPDSYASPPAPHSSAPSPGVPRPDWRRSAAPRSAPGCGCGAAGPSPRPRRAPPGPPPAAPAESPRRPQGPEPPGPGSCYGTPPRRRGRWSCGSRRRPPCWNVEWKDDVNMLGH